MLSVHYLLLAATAYNLALAGILLWKTRMYRAGRSFAWFVLGIAGWTLSCALVLHPSSSKELAVWAARTAFFCATFAIISWIAFCADFPRPDIRYHRYARFLILAGLPWFALAWAPWLVSGAVTWPWSTHITVGYLLPIFGLWLTACIVWSIIYLAEKRKRMTGLERMQIRYLLAGTLMGAVFGVFFNVLLPYLSGDTHYAYIGPLGSLFITTSTTYAIARYRLMDIRIVIRAGLVYSVTLGALSLLFALLVPVFDAVLKVGTVFPQRTGAFLLAFLMALVFQPLRDSVQTFVNQRLFAHGTLDYRQQLREACHALASGGNQQLILANLEAALDQTITPKGIAVFQPLVTDELVRVGNRGQWIGGPPGHLPVSNPLITLVRNADEVLLTDELIRQPGPRHDVGRYLHEAHVSTAVPLIAGERLCGLVLLGEKRSGDVYTTDDIAVLRILGKQAAIALDNARYYDEVEEMNEYHQRLLEIMQDGLIALDPQGRIITFNPAAERITGVPVAEALGRQLDALGLTQLPCQDTDGQGVETTLTTRAGAEVPVLASVTPFLRRWDVTPCRMLVFRDLSVLRALEQEKMQVERFSSLGAMAASLAHEIKNPLVPIQTCAHLLPTQYNDEEFKKEFVETVVTEVDRIDRLVNKMVDLVYEPTMDQQAAFEMRPFIEEVLGAIRPDCDRQKIRVALQAGEALPRVQGATAQLYQAFMNVLTNAVQAMADGGDLTISLQATGSSVICRITDTGPGVPPEQLPRIFEPLYTTKQHGHGLGLSLAYRFIQDHHGEIHAESAPGHGLTVVITLPADTRAALSC